MRKLLCTIIFVILALLTHGRKNYSSNGESIYKTGRNLAGELLLNKHASRIKLVKSCQGCHGTGGNRMRNISIQFSYLSNPANFTVPYTDSLFYRFLDQDLKSDGRRANIGVIWQMNDRDKRDLLEYLKTL
jgi:cytochrome c553